MISLYITLLVLALILGVIVGYSTLQLTWEQLGQDDRDKWNNDQEAWESSQPIAALGFGGFVTGVLSIYPVVRLLQRRKTKEQK